MPDPHAKLQKARQDCQAGFVTEPKGDIINVRYQYDVTCVATKLGYLPKQK